MFKTEEERARSLLTELIRLMAAKPERVSVEALDGRSEVFSVRAAPADLMRLKGDYETIRSLERVVNVKRRVGPPLSIVFAHDAEDKV